MNLLVTVRADYQGLAPSHFHETDPFVIALQIFELLYLMNFQLVTAFPAGGKRYVYYVCSGNKKDKNTCKSHNISEKTLTETVPGLVRGYIGRAVAASYALDMLNKAPSMKPGVIKYDDRIRKLKEEVASCQNRKKRGQHIEAVQHTSAYVLSSHKFAASVFKICAISGFCNNRIRSAVSVSFAAADSASASAAISFTSISSAKDSSSVSCFFWPE